MSGFFFILTMVIVLAVLAGILKPKISKDRSRIINADWLDSHTKFHMISRWGAQ
jgi:hypothetical protein